MKFTNIFMKKKLWVYSTKILNIWKMQWLLPSTPAYIKEKSNLLNKTGKWILIKIDVFSQMVKGRPIFRKFISLIKDILAYFFKLSMHSIQEIFCIKFCFEMPICKSHHNLQIAHQQLHQTIKLYLLF